MTTHDTPAGLRLINEPQTKPRRKFQLVITPELLTDLLKLPDGVVLNGLYYDAPFDQIRLSFVDTKNQIPLTHEPMEGVEGEVVPWVV